jgi:hypothetical protein
VSAPDLPRFKVASVTGYSARNVATGWYVLDTWHVHRVVSSYPVPSGRAGDKGSGFTARRRRELAEERCAELEAWHAEAMANDAA